MLSESLANFVLPQDLLFSRRVFCSVATKMSSRLPGIFFGAFGFTPPFVVFEGSLGGFGGQDSGDCFLPADFVPSGPSGVFFWVGVGSGGVVLFGSGFGFGEGCGLLGFEGVDLGDVAGPSVCFPFLDLPKPKRLPSLLKMSLKSSRALLKNPPDFRAAPFPPVFPKDLPLLDIDLPPRPALLVFAAGLVPRGAPPPPLAAIVANAQKSKTVFVSSSIAAFADWGTGGVLEPAESGFPSFPLLLGVSVSWNCSIRFVCSFRSLRSSPNVSVRENRRTSGPISGMKSPRTFVTGSIAFATPVTTFSRLLESEDPPELGGVMGGDGPPVPPRGYEGGAYPLEGAPLRGSGYGPKEALGGGEIPAVDRVAGGAGSDGLPDLDGPGAGGQAGIPSRIGSAAAGLGAHFFGRRVQISLFLS